jgi:aminopeptidase N
MRIKWVAGLLLMMAATASAQTATPASGVPLDVATRRAAVIFDLRYDLSLAIPKPQAEPITGITRITFDLRENATPLVIDFETSREHVKSVKTNDAVVPFEYVNGHIVLPITALKVGRNVVEIAFVAGNAPLNRSADFLYALFVPARARQAIPVFDQPDLKARWTLSLAYPVEWKAVSNGAEVQGSAGTRDTAPQAPRAMPANGRSSPGMVSVRFAETEPLSTYLFSFVVGDFLVETATRNGHTFRMFHRETDAAKVERNKSAIFDLHAAAIAYMEKYAGIPYAFGKFDVVLIPAFQFNGMEHAGKILYNASDLLLDESATQDQRLGRASVIAHETAHMWFGDLVTMRWFDDVWMKEVFANFMAAKIVNPSFPDVNHELRFLLAHYPGAYAVDRTPGANPIRQRLDNLNEAGSLYGAIIYQKAPVVMRHLEALLGEASFRDGLREYLDAHRFANATWNDLVEVLDRRTPADLRAWSRVWVEQPGRPVVTTKLEVGSGRITRLAFTQRDTWKRGTTWPQQLRVVLGYAEGPRTLRVVLDGENVEVKDAAGLPVPLYVLPTGEGWAYGGFELDRVSLAYLSQSLPSIADPLTRGSAWVTLWDALLDGALSPNAFMALAASALPKEADEQLTSLVLDYTGRVWWRFLLPNERVRRAAALELLLLDGLAKAGTPSAKAAWFDTLRNVALTPGTVAWLRRVWAKSESVPGLPLAETDYTALALQLAVREVDGWKEILAEQLGRIENPDRKERFEFVMPVLSADPKEREAWFRSLADGKNRRREPWVLEGLRFLHHPLRARTAVGFVAPSLDMLQEIQKTGDIFFPNAWLNATLGGHSSPEAAAIVRRFLATLPPDYPERLKNITLQSADGLFRATLIQERQGRDDSSPAILGAGAAAPF